MMLVTSDRVQLTGQEHLTISFIFFQALAAPTTAIRVTLVTVIPGPTTLPTPSPPSCTWGMGLLQPQLEPTVAHTPCSDKTPGLLV